ncbi:MAG: hypothetical protein WBB74_09220 [Gaiellaceae bacterium]
MPQRRPVVMNAMLSYQLSSAIRAEEIRRARLHPLAEVPSVERRAPRSLRKLFAPVPRFQVSGSTA